ncbi:FliM/FliN family flagellar motor switch protein [Massilia putida]|uniref:FliM/FliN family flagellar motor switch protein n=1 Tax=Massilia putida TaxID=1141883 RepID=UPI000953269D|nr:FliM/FliN family flagellar motor switch protein [Massilia putida]
MPIANSDTTLQHQVLDPCLLGRPVHQLPQFAARFQEDLDAAMQGSARRYWAGWRLEDVEFGRAPQEHSLRWMAVLGALGTVAVTFDRGLLLTLLERRYGGRSAAATQRDPQTERVTATEERLSVVLTQQMVDLLYARVAASVAMDVAPRPVQANAVVASSMPGESNWAVRVRVRDKNDNIGQFWIAPDQQLMATILGTLRPDMGRTTAVRGPAEPLATKLQVKLDGRLVSKEITLGALFDLKVGDVIPVNVGRADVLLDEARLFTAAVAEHKGKLCLTSFEDAE